MLYSRHAVSAGTYVRGATVGGAGVGGSVGSTTAPEPGDAAAHSRAHRGNNIVETVLESGGCEERCVQQEYVKVWCVGFLVYGVSLCDGNNCTVFQLCLQKEVIPPAGTHFQGDFIHDHRPGLAKKLHYAVTPKFPRSSNLCGIASSGL